MTDGNGTATLTEVCRTGLMGGMMLNTYAVVADAPGSYVLKFPRFIPDAVVGVNMAGKHPHDDSASVFFDLDSRTLYISYTGTGIVTVNLTFAGRVNLDE